eukprot:4726464-Alexandrium_andersonii.AAC.1
MGLEQGAVVGVALAFPRVFELALAALVAQPTEAPRLSEARRRLREALLVGPAAVERRIARSAAGRRAG